MAYLLVTPVGRGGLYLTSEPLGRGGEGTVYGVESHGLDTFGDASDLVAKLYHEPDEAQLQKLKAMISHPPSSTSVAWPTGLVFTTEREFKGYVMRRLPTSTHRPWSELAHAASRRKTAPAFDVKYALTAVRNLFVAVDSVHSAGHMIGDVNESNCFVGADASVLLVDTDSAQVASGSSYFPCLVGKPDYTARELQGMSFKDSLRTVESDTFGLGVLMYQMLTGGAHPTDATWSGGDLAPSMAEKIKTATYPGLFEPSDPRLSHPARIPTSALPSRLRALLLGLLAPDPAVRPSLSSAVQAIDETLGSLRQCSKVSTHWHDGPSCPWCAHAEAGLPDPWARESFSQALAQQVLPSLTFGDEEGPVVRRAAPARAGTIPPLAHPSPGSSPHGGAPNPSTPGQAGGVPSPGPSSPPAPSAPRKHKGKTVLTYPDGSSRVRPPLLALFRSQPRLALECLADETPDFAKFWWPPSRDLGSTSGLLAGLLTGLALAFAYVMVIPSLMGQSGDSFVQALALPAGVVAGAGATIASFLLLTFGLWDRHRAAKAAGGLDRFIPEARLRTVTRFSLLSLTYGPGLILALVAGGVALLFTLLVEALRPISGQR